MIAFVAGHAVSHRNLLLGSFPLPVTVTTMGYRSYKNPLNKAPLKTVTERGNDPTSYSLGFRVLRMWTFHVLAAVPGRKQERAQSTAEPLP